MGWPKVELNFVGMMNVVRLYETIANRQWLLQWFIMAFPKKMKQIILI
jgi:hypothetical protein